MVGILDEAIAIAEQFHAQVENLKLLKRALLNEILKIESLG